MTDKDRYGKKLGKGFLSVRPILCSDDNQAAVEAMARYIDRQMRKEIDIKALAAEVKDILGPQPSIFGLTDAQLERFERRTADSLAAEHFVEALRYAAQGGGTLDDAIEHLVRSAIESYRDCITLQQEYRDDVQCQGAFARHEAAIGQALLGKIRARCGLEDAPPATPRTVTDQKALIEFVVVSEL